MASNSDANNDEQKPNQWANTDQNVESVTIPLVLSKNHW